VHAWIEEKEARARGGKVSGGAAATPAAPVAAKPAVRVVRTVADLRPASASTPAPVVAIAQKGEVVNRPSMQNVAAVNQAPARKQQTTASEMAGEGGQHASSPVAGMSIDAAHERTTARSHTFQLPIPGKTSAFVTLPADITGEDWDMLKTILDVYVARLREQRAGAST
jgi:hypothetical protein